MIVFLHRKFSCERCINGHRSSTCEHVTASLVEIKGKGRPSTQCGHCKTRRSAAVGAHSKCVCGIVTAQVEGRKRVELHLTNGASLSFVASSPDELASVSQFVPGSSITLLLFRKDPRGKKQSPEPSDDGSLANLESGNGDNDLVGRSVDVPLAKVGFTEEAVDVNWEQVLRNPCQCRFGQPCICSTISSSTSRARKKAADTGPHSHNHSASPTPTPTFSDVSSASPSPRARPASRASPYVGSGPPPVQGGPHMGHIVFPHEQQANFAHVEYVAGQAASVQSQSPYQGWPDGSMMPNVPMPMPVATPYQHAPSAPYQYTPSLPIASPQYAYPYGYPTAYQAYANGVTTGTSTQFFDPSGGAFPMSAPGPGAAYVNSPNGTLSPATPTGHVPLTRHLMDLNLPSFSTTPASAPYGTHGIHVTAPDPFVAPSQFPVVQQSGSCCSNPTVTPTHPALQRQPPQPPQQPTHLTPLTLGLDTLPVCACGCFEPSSACDTCGGAEGAQCEEGALWNALGGGGGVGVGVVEAPEEGGQGGCCGGGVGCGCSGSGCGCGSDGLQNRGGCCGSSSANSGAGALQNGGGCCGSGPTSASGALQNGGGCRGNSPGTVIAPTIPGFAVPAPALIQATVAGSGGSCCNGSTPAPAFTPAFTRVGGCCGPPAQSTQAGGCCSPSTNTNMNTVGCGCTSSLPDQAVPQPRSRCCGGQGQAQPRVEASLFMTA